MLTCKCIFNHLVFPLTKTCFFICHFCKSNCFFFCSFGHCSNNFIHLFLSKCLDRKSTRLNSSHANISYAVFCLKKKKKSPFSSLMSAPLIDYYSSHLLH